MAKNADQQKRADVEAAIRSLYEMFPDIRSCRSTKTKAAMEIQQKIAARKEELESDPKLVSLQKQLHLEQQAAIEKIRKMRREIDSLLRRLRLRGPTPEVIAAIEKVSNLEPVVFYDDTCF